MDMIFYWGAALLTVFVVGKKIIKALIRVHDEKFAKNICEPAFKMVWFNERLESIFTKYDLTPPDGDTEESRLVQQASEFARLVAREATKRAGKEMSNLNDAELFATMLVAFVASDYISYNIQKAYGYIENIDERLSFEVVSMVACGVLGLQAKKSAEGTGRLIRETGEELNGMYDHPTEGRLIQSLGNRIAAFFKTGDDEILNELAHFHKAFASTMPQDEIAQQQEV